jgi:predicted DNA-binding protein (UPF0251 family)
MKPTQQKYLKKMVDSCESSRIVFWPEIKQYAEHEFKSLLLMIDWLEQMKLQEEMSTEQARIHVDIQKNTMRTRLMALPGIDMIIAEKIINSAVDSIRKELYNEADWVII